MSTKIFTLILMAATLLTGCGSIRGVLASSEFTDATDHFSVKFPGGASDIETEHGKAKNKYIFAPGTTYSKSFDNHSDSYRSYEVNAFSMQTDPPKDGLAEKTILSFGLNGWDDEPEATTKEVTINGMHALDCVRTVTLGPASMTFREVVFWSPTQKMLYVLRIAATNKANVSTKEAEDFIASFRMA
jgi:uncharacterized protein YceK